MHFYIQVDSDHLVSRHRDWCRPPRRHRRVPDSDHLGHDTRREVRWGWNQSAEMSNWVKRGKSMKAGLRAGSLEYDKP